MRTVNILGTGSYLPGKPIPNQVLERIFGTSEEWLSAQLGITSRPLATDMQTGRCSETNADMAADVVVMAGVEATKWLYGGVAFCWSV